MNKKLKFIDLFCGLGGFRLALEDNGCECVFSCDIDEAVKNVYKMNFGEYPSGDITQINADDIPDFDIMCAGFPCQPFSLAGKRLGFEDTRGTLFFEVARIAKAKKPLVIFLENVRGLINHDSGKTLETILNTLDEIGYATTWKVINAKDCNVPQNRERWYCVCFRKDLNININSFEFPKQRKLTKTLKDILEENVKDDKYKITPTCEKNINKFLEIKNIVVDETTLAYDVRPSRCSFATKGYSPCLTAKMGTGGNNSPVLVKENRKLTERECFSIMGFPTSYKIKKGFQAYKQAGNSVVVPIIQEISKEIVGTLKKMDV